MTLNRDARTIIGVVALVVAILGFGLTLWLNADQNARFDTAKKAQQAASKVVNPVICRLVYTYEHLDQSTPNAVQVAARWSDVGRIVGCPEGIKS